MNIFKNHKEDHKGLNIIVVGAGKVGSTLVEQLSKEGHDITIIDKNKTRVEKKLKENAFAAPYTEDVEEQYDFEVVKHKKFTMRPMDVDEAILQMNLQ